MAVRNGRFTKFRIACVRAATPNRNGWNLIVVFYFVDAKVGVIVGYRTISIQTVSAFGQDHRHISICCTDIFILRCPLIAHRILLYFIVWQIASISTCDIFVCIEISQLASAIETKYNESIDSIFSLIDIAFSARCSGSKHSSRWHIFLHCVESFFSAYWIFAAVALLAHLIEIAECESRFATI